MAHRLWPVHNAGKQPAGSDVLSDDLLRERALDTLRKQQALQTLFSISIDDQQLQHSLESIARRSRDRQRLLEMWRALDNDPVSIVEAMVRPALVDALLREAVTPALLQGASFDQWWSSARDRFSAASPVTPRVNLPALQDASCTPDSWSPIGGNAPVGRAGHSAIWTGSEMIVWGGLEGNYLRSGSRYDPATDTWSPISELGAPTGRAGHTAIWTGTEMIVWAGKDYPQTLEDGARYNPATDTWQSMSRPTMLGDLSRLGHSAVWTGSEMIIWGGANLELFIPTVWNNGARYNPVTHTWVALGFPGRPRARMSHSAVWTGTEMIVWGGETRDAAGNVVYYNDGDRWKPQFDVWQRLLPAGAPTPRSGHTAVWTGSRMVVWGGQELNTLFDTGGSFDPITGLWTATSLTRAPAARNAHTALWTGNRMLVWGGNGVSGSLQSGAGFDPVANSWTPFTLTNAPVARGGHSAVWTGSEMIVWGGELLGGERRHSGGRYNPQLDRWIATDGSEIVRPLARRLHTAVWTGSELLVWGGEHFVDAVADGSRYEPATDTWSALSSIDQPAPRWDHTAIWTGREMIVWGGEAPPGFNDGARYDPALDRWTALPLAGAPSARSQHSAVWTGREMIIWGGEDASSGSSNTGAVFDLASNSWRSMSTLGAPVRRSTHGALWSGTEMVVWGGKNPFPLGDGARYDVLLDRWRPTASFKAPPARSDVRFEWSGQWGVVWGGLNGDGSPTGEGARYDAFADLWDSIDESPLTPREHHTQTPMCGAIVVWGGSDPTASPGLPSEGAMYVAESDSWIPMSVVGAAAGRTSHTATAAGTQLIIFGGIQTVADTNSGGLYCGCAQEPTAAHVDHLEAIDAHASTTLRWAARPEAFGYDIVAGSLAALRGSAGNFANAGTHCVSDNTPATSIEPLDTITPGDGAWYLVRGVASTGPGSYDDASAGRLASRDAGVATATDHCP
ncbi:MAG: hypothetical protein U0V87_06835 [Acidobacteriota bacterium]